MLLRQWWVGKQKGEWRRRRRRRNMNQIAYDATYSQSRHMYPLFHGKKLDKRNMGSH
jgi:hypothetical protein